MSTAASPSSDTDPSFATDDVVIRSRQRSLTSNSTSTTSSTGITEETEPISTPASRTGEPGLSPGTDANFVFSEYRCQKNPLPPVTRKIVSAAITTAVIVRTPSFNSDHARERVRGMASSYDKKVRKYGSLECC